MKSNPIQILDFSSKVNQLQEKQTIQVQISQSAASTPKTQQSIKFTQTNSANLTPTNKDLPSKKNSLNERAGLSLPLLHPLKQIQDQILKRQIKVHEVIEEEKINSMTSVDKQVNQPSISNLQDKQTPLPDINFQPSRHIRQLYQQNIKHNNQSTSPKSSYAGTPYLSPASPLFQPGTPYLTPHTPYINSGILSPALKLRQKAIPLQQIQSPTLEETPDNSATNKYSQKTIVDDTPKQQNIFRVMKMMNNKLRLKTKDKENKFFNRYIKHYENCDTYFNVRQIFQSLNPSNKNQNSPLSNTFDESDLTPEERQALVTALEVEKKEREELMQKQNQYDYENNEEKFDQDNENNDQNLDLNSAQYSINGQKSSFYQSKFGQRSKMLQEIISMKSSFQNEKSPTEMEEQKQNKNEYQDIKLSEKEIFFMNVLTHLKNSSLGENDRITEADDMEANLFYKNLYTKLMEQLNQEIQNQEVKNSLNDEQTIQIQRIQEHIRRIKEENEQKNQQNEKSNKKRLEDEYSEFKKKSDQVIRLIRKGGYKIYKQKIKSLEEEEKKNKQILETINNFKEFKEQLKFKPLHHGNFTNNNNIRDRVRSMPVQVAENKFKKIESSPSQMLNMIKRQSYASLRTMSFRNDQTPKNQTIDSQNKVLIQQNTNSSINNVQISSSNIPKSIIITDSQRLARQNQDIYLTTIQNDGEEPQTNKNMPKREKQVSYSLDLKTQRVKQLELSRKQTIQIGSYRSDKSETSLKQPSQPISSDQDIQINGKVQINNNYKVNSQLKKQSSFYNSNNNGNNTNNQGSQTIGSQTPSNQIQGSPMNNSVCFSERKKSLSHKSAASNPDIQKAMKRVNSFYEQDQQNNVSTPKTSNFQKVTSQNNTAYPKKAQNLINQIFKNNQTSHHSIKSKEELLQSTELSKKSLINLSEIFFPKHAAFCAAIETKNQQKFMQYQKMQQDYKRISQSLNSSRQDDMQQSQQLSKQTEGEKQKYSNAYSQETTFHSSKSPLLILKNHLRKASAFQQKYSNKIQSLLYDLDFIQEENLQVKEQAMKTVLDSSKSYEQIVKENYPELECLRDLVEKSAIQNKIQKDKQFMKKIQN